MSSKRLPAGASSEIVAMIREGLTYQVIADALGVSVGTITYHAARTGLTRRTHARRIPTATRLCSRCGIETALPDLCLDCIDVLEPEEEA